MGMAYQVSQHEVVFMRIYCALVDAMKQYLLAVLCLSFLLSALFEVVRRKQGITATGGCAAFSDLMYAMWCFPCSVSWIVRTEKGVSLGHARRWRLLSSLGADDETEVLPVHQ